MLQTVFYCKIITYYLSIIISISSLEMKLGLDHQTSFLQGYSFPSFLKCSEQQLSPSRRLVKLRHSKKILLPVIEQ